MVKFLLLLLYKAENVILNSSVNEIEIDSECPPDIPRIIEEVKIFDSYIGLMAVQTLREIEMSPFSHFLKFLVIANANQLQRLSIVNFEIIK